MGLQLLELRNLRTVCLLARLSKENLLATHPGPAGKVMVSAELEKRL